MLDLDFSCFPLFKQLASVDSENEKYSSLIEELILENDMTYQDLNKVVKTKEEVLV